MGAVRGKIKFLILGERRKPLLALHVLTLESNKKRKKLLKK